MIKNCEFRINLTRVCQDCRSYYQTFKVDINKQFDESGKCLIKTQELYQKFSYICPKCGLLNIANINKLCNEDTVLFLREMNKNN